MPEQAVSFQDAKALMALAAAFAEPAIATKAEVALAATSASVEPRHLHGPGPAHLRPFAWRVTVPPARSRSGNVTDVIAPIVVRGLTRHEAADNAARTLFALAQVPKRRRPQLPRGTQVTRVRLSEAIIDTRSPRPEHSFRFG